MYLILKKDYIEAFLDKKDVVQDVMSKQLMMKNIFYSFVILNKKEWNIVNKLTNDFCKKNFNTWTVNKT